MIEPHNPWLRFMFVVIGTALAVRIAWLLIRPVLPEIAAVFAAAAISGSTGGGTGTGGEAMPVAVVKSAICLTFAFAQRFTGSSSFCVNAERESCALSATSRSRLGFLGLARDASRRSGLSWKEGL